MKHNKNAFNILMELSKVHLLEARFYNFPRSSSDMTLVLTKQHIVPGGFKTVCVCHIKSNDYALIIYVEIYCEILCTIDPPDPESSFFTHTSFSSCLIWFPSSITDECFLFLPLVNSCILLPNDKSDD